MYYPVNAPIGANVFYCREPVDGGGFVYYPVEMEDPGRLAVWHFDQETEPDASETASSISEMFHRLSRNGLKNVSFKQR
eukprot:m.268389 g.268389  ORF g.268389 m.268389 type:complete len:79 (-) comp16255_c2_seq4:1093-1329(-)